MWKRAPLLCAAIAGGVIAGWWVRTQGAPRQDPADGVRQRGHGELLIEYFDPACAGSRTLHEQLDRELERTSFRHVMVPVAIGRGADPVAADALCAAPDDQVWQLASAWSRKPPRRPDRGLDPGALRACAAAVESATQHIAAISGTGRVVTPLVVFRGRAYVGPESTPELIAALARKPVR